MKDTMFTLLLAFVLVIASLVNYSLFVRTKNAQIRHTVHAQSSGKVLSEQTQRHPQSWTWLLPLFGLPLLFYPFKGNVKDEETEETDDDYNYWPAETTYFQGYNQYGMGMKGGKSQVYRGKKTVLKPDTS